MFHGVSNQYTYAATFIAAALCDTIIIGVLSDALFAPVKF